MLCLDVNPTPESSPGTRVKVDVSKPDSVDAAFDETLKHFAMLIFSSTTRELRCNEKGVECTPDEWQAVLQVNLFGVFLCCAPSCRT